jgi:hypothetical protein
MLHTIPSIAPSIFLPLNATQAAEAKVQLDAEVVVPSSKQDPAPNGFN